MSDSGILRRVATGLLSSLVIALVPISAAAIPSALTRSTTSSEFTPDHRRTSASFQTVRHFRVREYERKVRKKPKLIRYSRNLQLGENDFVFKFRAPGKRKSFMTIELRF